MKAEYGMSVLIAPDDWRRPSLTLDALPGETPEQLLTRTADTVEKWFKERYNSQYYGPPIAPVLETQTDRGNPIESLLADIDSCKEVKVLESYKFLVKGNLRLQEAYDKKMDELKQHPNEQ